MRQTPHVEAKLTASCDRSQVVATVTNTLRVESGSVNLCCGPALDLDAFGLAAMPEAIDLAAFPVYNWVKIRPLDHSTLFCGLFRHNLTALSVIGLSRCLL